MGDFFLRYWNPPRQSLNAAAHFVATPDRSSAPEVEDKDIEEQAQIVADVRVSKNSAVDYAHPEVGVTTSGCVLHYLSSSSCFESD